MGIFSRLAQLIKSNLNDLISRSEDPERMLHQAILEMNSQLVEAKKQVSSSIADEKKLEKQFQQELANSAEWERRAMLAVRSDNETLAKEALARKKEYDSLAQTLHEQWQKQKTAVDQLKRALRMLNDKIEEAKRKQNVLIARKKRAEAQRAIQETMSGLTDQSAFETFDRMANKIDQIEAEAEAGAELAEEYSGDGLSSRFSQLETTRGTEDDLLALKRKMGLLPPEEVATGARVETTKAASEEEELAAALEQIETEQGKLKAVR